MKVVFSPIDSVTTPPKRQLDFTESQPLIMSKAGRMGQSFSRIFSRLVGTPPGARGESHMRAKWVSIHGAVLALVLGAGSVHAAYQVADVKEGGSITGQVTFAGPVPKLEPVKISKDTDLCGETARSRALVVSPKNRGVANTVVFLEGITQGKKPDPKQEKAFLNNVKCRFEPHVLGLMVKGKLAVKNTDPRLHNTHAYLVKAYPQKKRTLLNLALPLQDQVIKKRIRKAGVVWVQCDAHTHMQAWIYVLEHPYFAVTDANGKFTITNVPPGKYAIKAWHEGWKVLKKETMGKKGERIIYSKPVVLSKEVTVAPKGRVKVTFELK